MAAKQAHPKPRKGRDPDKPDGYYCDGHNREGVLCGNRAGWGTDHPGSGKCKSHGGASTGAPKGNKNAVTTGEYESILWDVLEPDERELATKIQMDKVKLLEEEIALVTIRERRMLKRIAELARFKMTLVEETSETTSTPTEQGAKSSRATKRKRQGTMGQIQTIEDGLTRVQAHKARLIELKHKFESGGQGDDSEDGLAALAEAIAMSARMLEGGTDGLPV